VASTLVGFFGAKEGLVKHSIPADEVIAIGAGKQAEVLTSGRIVAGELLHHNLLSFHRCLLGTSARSRFHPL
jgi:hypothetical protein